MTAPGMPEPSDLDMLITTSLNVLCDIRGVLEEIRDAVTKVADLLEREGGAADV